MKKYKVVEFIHIKSNNNTSNSKDIIIENFTNQIPLLQAYNQKGYNIYKSFNTFFDGKRRTTHINELRYVFIDLDYKDKEKEDYIALRKKCKILEKKYGIYPSEINETYKGYHLLYPIDQSLVYMKNEYYLDFANALIEYFDADKKAKQITGLYKVIGFIDHKENRNFLIENKFSATNTEKEKKSIKLDTLKAFGTIDDNEGIKDVLKDSIYGIRIKWDKTGKIDYSKFELEKSEKLLKIAGIIDKKTAKQDIYEMIENIDAKVFINAINEYEKGVFKGKKVVLNKNVIDGSHGLKLYYSKGKFEIKDFAEKKRFGNRLFILNHVLGMSQETSSKLKKEKMLGYIAFLREKFGIIFNKGTKSFYINSKLFFDYINNNIQLSDELLKDLSKKYKLNNYEKEDKLKFLNSTIYTYVLLEYIRQTEFMNVGKITVGIKKILSMLEITDTYQNRKKLKFILELGSRLELYFDYYNNNQKHINTSKRLYNILYSEDGTKITYNPIIGNRNIEEQNVSNSFILLNEKVFYSKGIFGKTYFKFMIYCIYSVKKFGNSKFTVNKIKTLLGGEENTYNSDAYLHRKITSYLKYLTNTRLIGYFERNKNTYSIGKINYAKIKEIKQKRQNKK